MKSSSSAAIVSASNLRAAGFRYNKMHQNYRLDILPNSEAPIRSFVMDQRMCPLRKKQTWYLNGIHICDNMFDIWNLIASEMFRVGQENIRCEIKGILHIQ